MYLVTIGEIFLKGKNRNYFQRKLVSNIQSALNVKRNKIKDLRNRIIVFVENADNLKYVFGINSYFKVLECDFNEMNENALSFIRNQKSFRISAQRINKNYKSSKEIEKEVGAFIHDAENIKVDLKNPEINIRIEIIGNKAYLYTKINEGLGGLPVGVSGDVFIDVNDEVKSALTAFLMMKRGCRVSLSKDLSLIHKFEHGLKINIREKNKEDVVVKDYAFENLKEDNSENFTLKPLVGYSEDNIKELYNKIKDL
ncbi:MAG TPA: THUMP domain-containing protein [Candidatus Nanoarchaeia archaeon]|nr:THUMP domain-containing protein [Candidatus Nanoarchaeia archaeon]